MKHIKLSRLSDRQLRRLLGRAEVRFGDNDKDVLWDVRSELNKYIEEEQNLRIRRKSGIEAIITRLDPRYAKNLRYEIDNIFDDSQRLTKAIKKVMDKISFTIKQMK